MNVARAIESFNSVVLKDTEKISQMEFGCLVKLERVSITSGRVKENQ